MNKNTEEQLVNLSQKYKEAYKEQQLAKTKLDKIKDEIKDLATEDYTNEIIKVSHISTSTPQYKEMIADSGITIPDKYIKHSTQVRITVKKPKKQSEPVDSVDTI